MGVWDPKGIPDGPIDSLSSARSREICNLFDPMIQESVAHPRPPQIPFANLGGITACNRYKYCCRIILQSSSNSHPIGMGTRGTNRDGDKGIGMGTRGGTDRDGTRGTDRDGVGRRSRLRETQLLYRHTTTIQVYKIEYKYTR